MKVIQIATESSYCTIKEYKRRSGMSEKTIRRRIKDGRIPIMRKQKPAELTLINLTKLAQMASED
ncbi:Rha family transcriptional regulator [Photobacterium halotolerans]|uniref:Rha family transcriptional regulator n=1 Tax=Photobacterium halotolerans TaxID=265726 RepID=UPI001372301A|nr:Rha family transcriptional regulator [Photobacterium halotolerans]NAW85658.1 Rha family transcriptional regulator [Photobacterium halotolerans]